jgi:hypothetical protein
MVVAECLKMTEMLGGKSVVFPPLGCERPFRYEVGAVASTMVKEAVSYIESSTAGTIEVK